MNNIVLIIGAALVGYAVFKEQIDALIFEPNQRSVLPGQTTPTQTPVLQPSQTSPVSPVTYPAPVAQTPPPSWAVGTFYATNPHGGTITMSISSDGRVEIRFSSGLVQFGSMNGTTLTNAGATAQVAQTASGIRTTSSSGEAIDYSRTPANTPVQPVPENAPIGGGIIRPYIEMQYQPEQGSPGGQYVPIDRSGQGSY